MNETGWVWWVMIHGTAIHCCDTNGRIENLNGFLVLLNNKRVDEILFRFRIQKENEWKGLWFIQMKDGIENRMLFFSLKAATLTHGLLTVGKIFWVNWAGWDSEKLNQRQRPEVICVCLSSYLIAIVPTELEEEQEEVLHYLTLQILSGLQVRMACSYVFSQPVI